MEHKEYLLKWDLLFIYTNEIAYKMDIYTSQQIVTINKLHLFPIRK